MADLIIKDGTSQEDRISPALKEGFINVDEMGLPDLLAMSADYGGVLNFTNIDNQPASDWRAFFSSDEAVIMSMILTTDLKKIEAEFFRFLRNPGPLLKNNYKLNKIPAYALAKKIDLWFKKLRASENDHGRELWQKISTLIEKKLSKELKFLEYYLRQYYKDAPQIMRRDFDAVWFGKGGDERDAAGVLFKGPDTGQVEGLLKSNFYSFLNALSFLKNHSSNLLPLSLKSRLHSPAIGLLIAFIKIFHQTQQKINGFTKRHLDFYCKDILNVGPRKTLLDSAYLVFQTDGHERKILIEKGAGFLAGTNEKKEEIIYRSDNDLLLRHIQVKELTTLYFERDHLSSPENMLNYITAARVNQIPLSAGKDLPDGKDLKSFPLFGAHKKASDKSGCKDANIGFALASPVLLLKEGQRDISISFKISCASSKNNETLERFLERLSSRELMLKDFCDEIRKDGYKFPALTSTDNNVKWLNGLLTVTDLYNQILNRKKNLDLNDELGKLRDRAEAIKEQKYCHMTDVNKRTIVKLNRRILELAYPENCPRRDEKVFMNKEDAFFKTFSNIFTIHLTTEKGWYEAEEYLPLCGILEEEVDKDTLQIQISLTPDADAIVPYSPEIHGGGYCTEQPVIRFVINPSAYIYPYSLLNNYIIKELEIEVNVKGARDAKIYNNLGQMDPNAPFNPFGPVPSVGSYFIVGNFETTQKHLTSFEVDAMWGDLPNEKGGFKEYYRAYGSSFDNSIFKTKLSVLSGSEWKPFKENEKTLVSLFKTDDKEGSDKGWQIINKRRLLSCNEVVKFFKATDRISTEEDFVYNSKSKDGFFKMTLSGPDYAFGHRDYPIELTKVLTANSRVKKPRFFRPVPNPPYTPLINSFSINYRAVATLNPDNITSVDDSISKERFYHIHPSGIERLLPGKGKNFTMVPQYDFDGNLFIGLEAKELEGIVTLFFHLCEDSSPDTEGGPSRLVWHYLSSDQWKRLEKHQVISDTTYGFLSSGIVTLNIPDDADRKNTIMPPDLFWLSVSVDKSPGRLCSLYSVRTNAMKVSCYYDGKDGDMQPVKIKADVIQKPKSSIPGIAGLEQLMDSFSDNRAEDREQFLTRITERMRHKNRAVTPWDYERLILEQFPELFKVKCFPNMIDDVRPEHRRRPGNILIVLIPSLQKGPPINLNPMVSALLLKKVREFAKGLSSPYTSIKVRNPAYEHIQVRCSVKFKSGASGGYYINLLDRSISEYLSPWGNEGPGASFGWSARRHDIMSFIGARDYVDFVTDYSMLHITSHKEGIFRLFDTVSKEGPEKDVNNIGPFYPWSIAVPMKRHFIETISDSKTIEANMTGIGELEVAGTFIIS